ncbi:MAG: MotA/TolQ/ExbB proton channel family protein [Candidatus Krumholzibacteriia bacterium]
MLPILAERTLEYLRQGGWVMAPLVVVSVVMWTLIIDRARALRLLRRHDVDLAGALDALRAGRTGPGEGLRARLVREFLLVRLGRPAADRAALRACAGRLRRDLDRHLAAVMVLAAVAPLLGLLGTVLGMIETFDVISVFGTGNARAMAGGISVALVTTQTGLLVAIPGFFLGGRLRSMAATLALRLDEVTAVLERHVHEAAALEGNAAGPRSDRPEPDGHRDDPGDRS